MVRTSSQCLECGGLGLRPLQGDQKNLNFLSTLLKRRVCANEFDMKAFEFGSDFDTVAWGKVSNCPPVFNCVSAPLGGATREY